MKKENILEKSLKYPWRVIEKNWVEKCQDYQPPQTFEEATKDYANSRGMNPLMILGIPVALGALTLYGIADGGKWLYEKIKN